MGGFKELEEKLGRNDLCPCGSGKRFQEMLPQERPLSTEASGTTTSASSNLEPSDGYVAQPRAARGASAVAASLSGDG